MNLKNLHDERESNEFYEVRYSEGYMEDWPIEKRKRVLEFIKNLNLPDQGEALDFGCGNGIFTDLLKEALPKWIICGCDISEIAIQNASKRFPRCNFFRNNDIQNTHNKFDFIFSHHVLEHVFDIEYVANQINECTKKGASMLHILPCGNRGSFEYNLCEMVIDGIDTKTENRFFLEDEGHIRRMTTEQCVKLFNKFDFMLKKDYYGNQYYGAIEWITNNHPRFLFNIFNPFNGKDLRSKFKLCGMLFKFLIICSLRVPNLFYNKISKIESKKKEHIFFLMLCYIPSRISKYFDNYIKQIAADEWNTMKTQKNGSEMYLFFDRKS